MDKQKAYNKNYYETHKEDYKGKYNRKIKCELCGKEYGVLNWSKHTKSQKHILHEKGIECTTKGDLVKRVLNTDSLSELLKRVADLERVLQPLPDQTASEST